MNRALLLLCLVFSLSICLAAQQLQSVSGTPPTTPVSYNQLDAITVQLGKISHSVDQLQGNWKNFFAAFSTNQGLQLSERQQKLLLAFEVLNRAEQRLGNLQRMRMESTEKISSYRLQLARITNDLLPESIDRYVATRGSLNAEQLRDIRRQSLIRERTEISNVVNQIQSDLDTTNNDIHTTEQFLRNLRNRIFPELEKELADL